MTAPLYDEPKVADNYCGKNKHQQFGDDARGGDGIRHCLRGDALPEATFAQWPNFVG